MLNPGKRWRAWLCARPFAVDATISGLIIGPGLLGILTVMGNASWDPISMLSAALAGTIVGPWLAHRRRSASAAHQSVIR